MRMSVASTCTNLSRVEFCIGCQSCGVNGRGSISRPLLYDYEVLECNAVYSGSSLNPFF